MEEYGLYIDESGSPKPKIDDPCPHFAMGGVIVKRADGAFIADKVAAFKEQWNIPDTTALHSVEIRNKSHNFAWLGDLSNHDRDIFYESLAELIVSAPVIVHACVISRQGYRNRYLDRYGDNTWNMMQSAFNILVERAVKYVAKNNGKMMTYYEKIGPKEDRLLEQYFRSLRANGHPFDKENAAQYLPPEASMLQKHLSGIKGKKKSSPEMQLADLCLFPVAVAKARPLGKDYLAMKEKKLLVDQHLLHDEQRHIGIKYSCFDDT